MTVPHDDVFLTAPEEQLICRILRGEASPWPADGGAPFEQRFLEAWRAQGLGPLVHHCLPITAFWNDWPAACASRLIREARMQAAADMLRERELVAVLAALADAGVATLLLKGAALAYSHYPEPALRTRCDTDVLVATGPPRHGNARAGAAWLPPAQRGQRHAGELRGVLTPGEPAMSITWSTCTGRSTTGRCSRMR